MINFIPKRDIVLIERVDSNLQKRTEKAGLILPDNVKDDYKSMQGILISAGDGCDDWVKELVGKEILFNRYSGDEIKLNNKEFLLATQADIFGEIKHD